MVNVPFFVQRNNNHHHHHHHHPRGEGQYKAIFTVPDSLTSSLIVHPIVCRGGMFPLQIDAESQGLLLQAVSVSEHESVGFLSTEFDSPDPEAVAFAIATRLAHRADDALQLLLSTRTGAGVNDTTFDSTQTTTSTTNTAGAHPALSYFDFL